MPKIYKPSSKFAQYDSEIMKAAVESVREKKLSAIKAAEKYGIKRSTLQNRVNGKHSRKQGGQCALSEDDEKRLKEMLLLTSHWGFPMTKIDLRHVTKNFLENSNKKISVFKNNFPGDDWAKSFLHRNGLSLRNTQNITPARARVTIEVMEKYFDNLESVIKNIPPENIANYDETNFTDNPDARKAIFRRGVKYPENVIANSKSSTSVMFCGTATGLLLPIYIVYRAKNVYNTWLENGPPGARYNATLHGWFEANTFIDWFRSIYLPHARTLSGPKVLIGDNLSSHFSEEVILLAQQVNIYFVCLPPNCTHIAQPLDVTFFAPLKKLWRTILLEYKLKNPKERVVPKHDFPNLMNRVWQELHSKNKVEMNLKAGFQTCGIFPFDKAPVMKKIDKTVAPGVDKVEALSDAVLDYMKSLREPEAMTKRGRRKKVTTSPGKSVTIEDFTLKKDIPAVNEKSKVSIESSSSSDEEFIEDCSLNKKTLSRKRKLIKKSVLSTKKPKRVTSAENSIRDSSKKVTLDEAKKLKLIKKVVPPIEHPVPSKLSSSAEKSIRDSSKKVTLDEAKKLKLIKKVVPPIEHPVPSQLLSSAKNSH